MMKLLNPGPVSLTSRVRLALQQPDLCHREPEFAQLQDEIRQGLLAIYEDCDISSYSSVLLTGSGTAAVEAMLASLTPVSGLPTLVLANGVYGERMASMLERQGKPLEVLRQDWLEALDLAQVERRLKAGGVGAVAAVHHETTTGRLNDIAGLGRICRQRQVPLLLDAVSSFGGEEIGFQDWNLLACAATANKCLHGVPGVSFVVARREALAESGRSPCLYLDLGAYYREQERRSSPFTQAVHACYALHEALAELSDEGGWRQRSQTYQKRMQFLREGLEKLGIQPLLSQGGSSILGSFRLPDGISYECLHDRLKEAGFVIYAGQGGLSSLMFRLAVMGDLSRADLTGVLQAVGEASSDAPLHASRAAHKSAD